MKQMLTMTPFIYLSYSYGSVGKPPSTSQIIVLPFSLSSVLKYSSLPAFDAEISTVFL